MKRRVVKDFYLQTVVGLLPFPFGFFAMGDGRFLYGFGAVKQFDARSDGKAQYIGFAGLRWYFQHIEPKDIFPVLFHFVTDEGDANSLVSSCWNFC